VSLAQDLRDLRGVMERSKEPICTGAHIETWRVNMARNSMRWRFGVRDGVEIQCAYQSSQSRGTPVIPAADHWRFPRLQLPTNALTRTVVHCHSRSVITPYHDIGTRPPIFAPVFIARCKGSARPSTCQGQTAASSETELVST
jgi:hypothetical protein